MTARRVIKVALASLFTLVLALYFPINLVMVAVLTPLWALLDVLYWAKGGSFEFLRVSRDFAMMPVEMARELWDDV